MNLTHIILGPLVTEKAERLKTAGERHTYTMKVAPNATKTDVKNALKKFYESEVESVRIIWVRSKSRPFGRGQLMEKRHRYKKAIVTLKPKSRALDLASFKTNAS